MEGGREEGQAQKAVCLWWDLEDGGLNSKARHVVHTDVGEEPAERLFGGGGEEVGLTLQVWVTGLPEEGEGGRDGCMPDSNSDVGGGVVL